MEYYSVTHGVRLPEGIGPLDGSDRADLFSISAEEWLPATIIDTDTFGRVMIDLRPGVWLSSAWSSMSPEAVAAEDMRLMVILVL